MPLWPDWGGQQPSPQSLWGHSQDQGLLGSKDLAVSPLLSLQRGRAMAKGTFNIN